METSSTWSHAEVFDGTVVLDPEDLDEMHLVVQNAWGEDEDDDWDEEEDEDWEDEDEDEDWEDDEDEDWDDEEDDEDLDDDDW